MASLWYLFIFFFGILADVSPVLGRPASATNEFDAAGGIKESDRVLYVNGTLSKAPHGAKEHHKAGEYEGSVKAHHEPEPDSPKILLEKKRNMTQATVQGWLHGSHGYDRLTNSSIYATNGSTGNGRYPLTCFKIPKTKHDRCVTANTTELTIIADRAHLALDYTTSGYNPTLVHEASVAGDLPWQKQRCECRVSEVQLPWLGGQRWRFDYFIKGFGDSGLGGDICGYRVQQALRRLPLYTKRSLHHWRCIQGRDSFEQGTYNRHIVFETRKFPRVPPARFEKAIWYASKEQFAGCKCDLEPYRGFHNATWYWDSFVKYIIPSALLYNPYGNASLDVIGAVLSVHKRLGADHPAMMKSMWSFRQEKKSHDFKKDLWARTRLWDKKCEKNLEDCSREKTERDLEKDEYEVWLRDQIQQAAEGLEISCKELKPECWGDVNYWGWRLRELYIAHALKHNAENVAWNRKFEAIWGRF